MRLVIQTPFWKRYELSSQMMRHTHTLALEVSDRIDVELVAVISEQKYVGMAARYGWRSTWAENGHLGTKGNHGMAWTGTTLYPDGVLMLGSDDFADAAYVRAAGDALQRGVDLWGVRDIVFENGTTGQRVHWQGYPQGSGREGETLGAGRMLSRKFLDACQWAPWQADQSRAMDASMLATFDRLAKGCGLRHEATELEAIGAQLVDVKTDESLTSWDAVSG